MRKVVRRKPASVPQRAGVFSDQSVPTATMTYNGGFFSGDERRNAVLGIDASLTGFAVVAYCPDDETYYGWLYTSKYRGARRLSDIMTFLDRVIVQLKLRCPEILHVCMEGYSFGSQAQHHKIGELGGVTKVALLRTLGWSREVAYPTLVAPTSLKKFILGVGAGKKNEILLGVYKKWGVDFNDDNIADAYGLARLAATLHTGSAELAYEREVVARLETHTEWEQSPSK